MTDQSFVAMCFEFEWKTTLFPRPLQSNGRLILDVYKPKFQIKKNRIVWFDFIFV